MRRWARASGYAVLVTLLIGSLLAAHSWYFKPLRIGWFYERVFLRYALEDPELMSRLRLFGPLEHWHNDELTDVSPAQEDRLYQLLHADAATLQRYDRSGMRGEQALSYDTLAWFYDLQLRGERFRYHDFPVNQLFGVQVSLPSFLADVHAVRSPGDGRDYLARLHAVPRKFAQLIESLQARAARGLYPPRFAIDKVLAQMRAFRAQPAADNLLYTSLVGKLRQAPVNAFDTAAQQALLAATAQAIEDAVYPAYDALIAELERERPQAASNDGIWRMPDGDACYDYLIEAHTTLRLDAGELHALGLAEVARIEGEMMPILTQAGYTEGSVGERLRALMADPAQHYPDTEAGRAAVLADYTAIINAIHGKLGQWFHAWPEVRVEVRPVPTFSEASAPGAYYQPPAMDGSRPGVFNINLRRLSDITRFGMRTLAYHEAIPGHHLQISLAQQLKDLPTFRRVVPYTAYVEGWALYAEQLAGEAGFLPTPLDQLGRLQSELFRSARLVVDTGLHRQRWSRERAIDYLQSTTGMSADEATSEVERYLVYPGQALAYKVGLREFLRLRELARARFGVRFDIREFHRVVLEGGSLPLAVLGARVQAWIDSQSD